MGFSQTRSLLEKQTQSLDIILKTTTEQVEALQIKAELSYLLPAQKYNSMWFRYLQDNEQGEIFSLDTIPITLQEFSGNLTGIGTIKKHTKEFYNDINVALELYSQFVITMKIVPYAQWVYFTSSHRFFNVYPWVPSTQNHFTDDSHKKEFFTGGTPDQNPERSLFWTPIYLDEAGMGLMVTLAAPIYSGDVFKGTVALDITLFELNNILSKAMFSSPNSLILLVNNEDQVLAHPTLKLPKGVIYNVADVLPEELKTEKGILHGYPENKIYEINGYTIRYKSLEYAPWKLVFIRKK